MSYERNDRVEAILETGSPSFDGPGPMEKGRLDVTLRSYGSRSLGTLLLSFVERTNGFLGSNDHRESRDSFVSFLSRFLSLLLKRSSLIDEISLYDKESTDYLASELNQVDTRCKVTTYPHNKESLTQTLQDAKVVVLVAGKNLKYESTPTELLESNAEILSDLLPNVIRSCPRAMLAIAMQPINSLIPVAVEMYKKAGIYEYKRIFGVNTLDCVRANSFVAKMVNIAPECVMVPVIGGCCPHTRIPLFSQMIPRVFLSAVIDFDKYQYEQLLQEIDKTRKGSEADEEVSKGYNGQNVSVYASAFAIARFCISLCKAIRQQSGVVECAYVRSCVIPEVTYFASQLELGPDGIQKYLGIQPLNDDECKLLLDAIPVLTKAISQGETLALGSKSSSEKCPIYPDVCHRAFTPTHIRRI
ncbi:malate dehydrogenase, mitochondrial-like [Vespula pensylvanica]|uniref:malate dehydrogenase, mitochondrial-like n=1 Tax=Vespula pensylvanica TaxID=30213 RepID=UPI001CBA458D|nr:malate dehydrogenase, mitochondrial-like [Vespula pensylvanica]